MPAERIVLAGFSQGGAIALHTALREPRPLGRRAGAVDLSAARGLARERAQRRERGRPDLHGARHGGPGACRSRSAKSSRRALEALGYAVDWHAYPMAHSVCLEEIGAIGAWLAALPASASAKRRRSSSKRSRTSPTCRPAASNERSANVARPAASTSTTVEQRVP